MEHENLKINLKTSDIVQISLMAAITYAVTAFINVPTASVGVKGLAHLGDSVIFLAAILLRRRNATLSAAIGMALFDLLSPYAIWAPFTFIIKGGMAYIAATIAYRRDYNGKSVINNIFAFVVSGIWMIAAYYFSGVALNSLFYKIPLNQSFIIQTANIPADIAQVVVGIIIAVPMIKLLNKANINRN